MSTMVTKTPPTYLKEARLEAGYVNRGTASTRVPYSPEVIGRHERGDVPVDPEDVLIYAECYGRNDILFRYCADCPVGRATGKQVTDRILSSATLRLNYMLSKVTEDIVNTLSEIAFDDKIDEVERPIFDEALETLMRLGRTIDDIVLYAATRGIRKEAAHGSTKISKQAW